MIFSFFLIYFLLIQGVKAVVSLIFEIEHLASTDPIYYKCSQFNLRILYGFIVLSYFFQTCCNLQKIAPKLKATSVSICRQVNSCEVCSSGIMVRLSRFPGCCSNLFVPNVTRIGHRSCAVVYVRYLTGTNIDQVLLPNAFNHYDLYTCHIHSLLNYTKASLK